MCHYSIVYEQRSENRPEVPPSFSLARALPPTAERMSELQTVDSPLQPARPQTDLHVLPPPGSVGISAISIAKALCRTCLMNTGTELIAV